MSARARTAAAITIRHPRAGESVPESLLAGCEIFAKQPEHVWLAEQSGSIIGLLLTAELAGLLLLLRINSVPDSPSNWTVILLRQVLREASARGYMGFLTLLQDTKPQEVKLMRIVQRNGGVLMPFSGAIAFGKVETGY